MKQRSIPQRKCVGCGLFHNKKDLVRIVSQKDGSIHLDETGKSQGRGAYLCKDPQCLEKAFHSKGLERSLKKKVSKEVCDALQDAIHKK